MPFIELAKLLKVLNFFNFKVNILRLDYLKSIAIVAAEILAGLHKVSFNFICLSTQLLMFAKCKFAKIENVQDINFRLLSIFCSFIITIFSKFLDLDWHFLKKQKAMLSLMLAAKESLKFFVILIKKFNFAISNKNANSHPPVIILFILANATCPIIAN